MQYPVLPFIPLLFIAYGWLAYFHVHIAGIVVVLFFLGTCIMVVYSSTLAYIVDANPGRSTTAVACNSLFRGVLACAASQAAEPILNKVYNGAFYTGSSPFPLSPSLCSIIRDLLFFLRKLNRIFFATGWGILLLIGEAFLVLMAIKGGSWRAASREKEERANEKKRERDAAKVVAAGGPTKA